MNTRSVKPAMPQARVAASLPKYEVIIARTDAQIRAAQRLRYQVFAEEMGAQIESAASELDIDNYDAYCQHLLVFETGSQKLIATTRLLDQPGATLAGGFYSASEFDLNAIAALPGAKLEVGRSCVAPDHRNGAAISVLWQALGQYALEQNIRWMFGCASVPWQDTAGHGVMVQAIMQRFRNTYLVAPELRVQPRRPVPGSTTANVTALRLPPLLKAYISLGAKVGGEPCWDPDFAVADFFMLLDLQQINARYAKRFFGRG